MRYLKLFAEVFLKKTCESFTVARFVMCHFVYGVKKMYISDVLKGDYSLIEAFLKASFSSSSVKLPER